jgi:hypothetical protein
MQGREKLKVDWTAGEHAVFTSERFKKTMVETVHQPQKVVRNVGNVNRTVMAIIFSCETEDMSPEIQI